MNQTSEVTVIEYGILHLFLYMYYVYCSNLTLFASFTAVFFLKKTTVLKLARWGQKLGQVIGHAA